MNLNKYFLDTIILQKKERKIKTEEKKKHISIVKVCRVRKRTK